MVASWVTGLTRLRTGRRRHPVGRPRRAGCPTQAGRRPRGAGTFGCPTRTRRRHPRQHPCRFHPPRRSAAPQPTQRRSRGPNPAASPACSRPVPHPPDVGQDPGQPAAYRATDRAPALAAHCWWPRGRGHWDRRPTARVAAPLQGCQSGVRDRRSAPRPGRGRCRKRLGGRSP
jgi:hypothetical protein